jgi:uncharacterized SAM-binding protein YcdF (DUF218 family)
MRSASARHFPVSVSPPPIRDRRPLWSRITQNRLWRRAVTGSAIAFWIIVTLHVSPVIPAISNFLTDRWEDAAGDILIVLSAEQLGDGTIGYSSYWRTVYAVRAYNERPFRKVVFSGGTQAGPGGRSTAAAMAEFAIGLGLPRDVVVLEERSRSTRENAVYTAEMIRGWPGTKVLLTSDCHIRRARRCFARAGLTVIPAPVPDIGKRWNSWVSRPECIWIVLVELTKNGYYMARGWI